MTHLAPARFNSDGYMDAVASRMACCADGPEVEREIFLFTGGADGTLTLLTTLEIDDPPANAALADLNGDALDDVLALTPSRAVPFINDGSGVFAPRAPVDATTLLGDRAPGDYDFRFLGARDFNQDGATDLAFYTRIPVDSSVPEQAHVLPGDGFGGFAAPVTTDINGDGSPDRWDRSDGELRLYLGHDAIIPPEPTQVLNVPALTGPFFREDLNGDGVWDITLIDQPGRSSSPYAPYVLSVFFGGGDGTFEGPWSRALPFYSASIFFADVGGDRRRELLVSGLEGTGQVANASYRIDCSEP